MFLEDAKMRNVTTDSRVICSRGEDTFDIVPSAILYAFQEGHHVQLLLPSRVLDRSASPRDGLHKSLKLFV